ncbi:cytochrome b [Glaciimonas immobilis]|uniref:Cytochrome b561 n=1 Tax=Glaciimonas immobilis TaxID=728004 RepID=A0A840RZC4_9BURK|nr:cytochrome b [Glaciimonas immobilis]KAF3996097.1 cytochrome b [Glaciimonas immobilis]MBB5201760.1 cytochrome b561 [Glaciimonas immobilis]
MKNINSPTSYTTTAISMHWLVGLLIFAAFGIGWYMTGIHGLTPQKLKLFSWHKWLGVTIFGLAVIRVAWRLLHPAPALPPGMPRWQQQAAHVVHQVLYVLIIVIPVTGYLYSAAAGVPVVYLGLFKMPMLIEKNDQLKTILAPTHVWLNYLMATIVVAHILAALKHQLIDRDGTLGRMLPFLK